VVTINPAPAVVITNPAAVCAPATVDITAAAVTAGSTPGLTFTYFTDAAGTIALATPNAVAASGTYYIKGTTAAGCSAIQPVVVTINPPPIVSVSSDTNNICKGAAVTLTAVSPGNSITWLNVGTGNSVVVNPLTTTTYTAQATTASGCSDTASVTVIVKPFTITLTANPDPVLAGTTLNLSTSANLPYSVTTWLPSTYFLNQSLLNQTILISDTNSTFTVIGMSTDGCLDTASVTINIGINKKDFYIPNTFTPNGDGRNDIFRAYGSSIKDIDLRVYTQWGGLLFESRDLFKGWDGNFNGNPQPTGVFVYLVRVVFNDNTVITKKGTVNLIR